MSRSSGVKLRRNDSPGCGVYAAKDQISCGGTQSTEWLVTEYKAVNFSQATLRAADGNGKRSCIFTPWHGGGRNEQKLPTRLRRCVREVTP
jgi:hypothetical protein